jgi:hypothetical protein
MLQRQQVHDREKEWEAIPVDQSIEAAINKTNDGPHDPTLNAVR